MEHNLKISVTCRPRDSNIASVGTITVRERILSFLFGKGEKITIIVPGNSIRELAINEVKGGKKIE